MYSASIDNGTHVLALVLPGVAAIVLDAESVMKVSAEGSAYDIRKRCLRSSAELARQG
jgi:hypothetical protein